MAMLRMAQHNNGNHSSSQQSVKAVFHDFMGMKPTDSPIVAAPKTAGANPSEASPSSVSVSVGASSGGARGPLSTTSDIASERQLGNHLEGVPFYCPRSDLSGTEISNRIVGNKRSNSDSSFMSSSRDAFQMVPDSLQNLHLMKSRKPTVASHIYQPSMGSKTDVNKWDRSILMNTGSSMQHPPHGGQLASFVHQIPSNKSRDANTGPSFISQSAADEGSRTGMKSPGILSSMNTTTAAYEKTLSAPGRSRSKPVTGLIDPESSMPPSQQGLASASCQMTIFYGGQAHVFDNVHPNKAEIIMALAGSNGGCWSTTYSPKPAVKLTNDSNRLCGDSETGTVSKITPPQEPHGRISFAGASSLAIKSGDRLSTQAGARQGSVAANEDVRNSVKAADPRCEDKRTQSH
ncbi:protein TIFY 8-like isoform X2 [Prosopis cineraria]|uniref:protein TIFY 8-like isoform X2 n=1 Tax=Prosopis cineraria TaxID=364024 RepID=UPI0024104F7B|nr:protein TIFY 8-like isoform X2 [Prosopis cineraria]